MLLQFILVGSGGFLGSLARYLMGLFVKSLSSASFPWATLVVNSLGCFAMGFLFSFSERPGALSLSRNLGLFLSVGFLGGFTTFSAFGIESLQLLKNQDFKGALLNISANLLLGLGAAWAGSLLKFSEH